MSNPHQTPTFHKLLVGLVFSFVVLSVIPNGYSQGPGSNTAYQPITNPSTGDTLKLCPNGICYTGPAPTINRAQVIAAFNHPNDTKGFVQLNSACVNGQCAPATTIVTHLGNIGIQLSMACMKLEQSKMNSTCMSYGKLKQFDNTNTAFAGKWINDTWYHRASPRIKNHENFNPNPWVVMVDPNSDFTTHAKMIIVTDSNFTYIDPRDTSVEGKQTLSYKDRFVDSSCTEATVAPNINLISDTLSYMESGCTVTNYNATIITKHVLHPFDWTHSYIIKEINYKTAAKKVTTNCITVKCVLPKDTLHATGFGWN